MPFDDCDDCGGPEGRVRIGSHMLCDRCADKRIVSQTGFPALPHPPPPIEYQSPAAGKIEMRFRLWRVPTGIEMALEQVGCEPGEGFHLAVLGDHDAEPEMLAAYLKRRAEDELNRTYLEPNQYGTGWRIVERHEELAGRLIWNEYGPPHDVIIDGHRISWEQLGQALEGFEGWRFRLVLQDPVDDLRVPDDPTRLARDTDR